MGKRTRLAAPSIMAAHYPGYAPPHSTPSWGATAKRSLLVGASVLALVAASDVVIPPRPAYAVICANASGDGSQNAAIGEQANASGNSSDNVASGTNSNASGTSSDSIASGENANASGDGSRNIATGFNSNASGDSSNNVAGGRKRDCERRLERGGVGVGTDEGVVTSRAGVSFGW